MNKEVKRARHRIMRWLEINNNKRHMHIYRMMSELYKNNEAYYIVRYRLYSVSHYHELVRCLCDLGIHNYHVAHNDIIAPRGGAQGLYLTLV